MDGLDPAEGRIAHCRVAEDERSFAVLRIVAGGDGVKVGFEKLYGRPCESVKCPVRAMARRNVLSMLTP